MAAYPSSGNLDPDAPLVEVAVDSFVTLLSSTDSAEHAAFSACSIFDLVLDQLNDRQKNDLGSALLAAVAVHAEMRENMR